MIKRKIESELNEWKNSKDTKPVVLRGARQVGKTFIVRHFARSFSNFIELNLERPRERELFNYYNSGRELFEKILLYKGISVDEADTLLFIDEIQHSKKAVEALRYFYEDLDQLRVIAAGSLLEVYSEKEGFSFPVGRVRSRYMFPLSFGEYLEYVNPKIKKKLFELDFSKTHGLHEILLNYFHEFSIIGGMPEAVSEFRQTGSYATIRDIYDSLLLGYVEDVEKYSNLAKAKYLSFIIDRAPLYVGERIIYEKFGDSFYRSREMSDAFDVLEKALILFRSRPTSSRSLPLKAQTRKAPKLFFLDIGLVNYRIGIDAFFDQTKPLDDVLGGRLAEQIVAQELMSLDTGLKHLNFWVREQGLAEIDFIFPYKGRLIPLEVKKGATGKLKSLHSYMDKCQHPYAVRVYSGTYRTDTISLPGGKEYQLLSLPFYFLPILNEVLDWFVAGN